MSNVINAMPNIRFLTDEESREILQKAIIELSSQVDTLKAQAESSRIQMETLLTQNSEIKMLRENSVRQNTEIEEIKAKNMETHMMVDTLKAQSESSRIQMETLLTQNAELSAQIQEVKAKNLETSTKFEKFVHALYKPSKPYDHIRVRLSGRGIAQLGIAVVDNLQELITDSVKAAGMT
jgi:chromosome segregation ATPase